MRVAVVTFDGFNELDSLIAAHIINRVGSGWRAEITAPAGTVTSMNGVSIRAQQPLEFVSQADAVILGSGRRTREMIEDDAIMSRLRLDPSQQLIASQCSGALILIRLGLLEPGQPVCTDRSTQTWVEAAGHPVLDQPFLARGRVATAGGCLASQYLAAWMIWSAAGRDVAAEALRYVLPHGEEPEYLQRTFERVGPFVVRGSRDEAAIATNDPMSVTPV